MTARIDRLRASLDELAASRDAASLSEQEYLQMRQQLEQSFIDQMLRPSLADRLLPTAAQWAALALVGLAVLGFMMTRTVTPPARVDSVSSVLALARSFGPAQISAPSGGEPVNHGTNFDQIERMAASLAQRLAQNPQDGDGWAILARSYSVLGRHAEAVPAFKQATRLVPDDAGLLADYADALAVANGRDLSGEPESLARQALSLDAANPKALSLVATADLRRGDRGAAVAGWRKVIEVAPADHPLRQQAQLALQDASASPRAGMAAKADEAISGQVTIDRSLKDRLKAGDTLFVFARNEDGPPMPLAVYRTIVSEGPMAFRLDDSLAMSPAAKLSGATRVTLGARISHSGDATAQGGDLQGHLPGVLPGASDIALVIDKVVQ